MNKVTTFLLMLFTYLTMQVNISAQTIITKWDFEGDVTTPVIGSGSIVLIGGTTATFATGFGGGRGWNTTNYPAQGTAPKTAGVQINVSTSSFSNIIIKWDHRHSNSSSNKAVLMYTLDVSVPQPVWIQAEFYFANAGDTWFQREYNFSAVAAMNNNPNVAFRIVSDFADGSSYIASNPGSSYGGGTWRFDNVTISGTAAGSALSVSTTSLTGFNYSHGSGPSSAQSYTLSGSNLAGAGNISVTAPANYEVSLDSLSYSALLQIPFSGGAIINQPVKIYVRLKAGLSVGTYNNELITNSGGGAAAITVSCDGFVSPDFSIYPIKMNEIYSRGTTSDPDWIEIYNTSPAPMDLTGYKIYDIGGQGGTKPKKLFPNGTIIPANGFYVIVTDDADPSGFGLSSNGEEVWLEDAAGTVIDNVIFPAMDVTQSYGRLPDGGTWQLLNNITKGFSNVPVGVDDDHPIIKDFILYQNYPNPFNPETIIKYQIPTKSFVNLKILDVLGREVASLVNEIQDAGTYSFNFNGTNLSSGIYFYSLSVDGHSITKKLNLLK